MNTNVGAGARTPPRFVPTLTEVVQVPEGLLPSEQVCSHAPAPVAVPEPSQQLIADPAQGVFAAPTGEPVRADALLWSDAPAVPWEQPAVVAVQPTQTWPTPDLMEALGVLITEQVMQRLELRLAVLVNEQAGQLVEHFARNLTEALSRQMQAEVPDLVQQALALAVQPVAPDAAWAEHQRGFSPIYGTDRDSG